MPVATEIPKRDRLSDVVQQRRMIDESEADETFKRVSYRKLDALVGLAESAGCRREIGRAHV